MNISNPPQIPTAGDLANDCTYIVPDEVLRSLAYISKDDAQDEPNPEDIALATNNMREMALELMYWRAQARSKGAPLRTSIPAYQEIADIQNRARMSGLHATLTGDAP